MSKATKKRKELLLTVALATKIDNMEDKSHQDVYSSKKSEDSLFLDIVEESISKGEALSQENKKTQDNTNLVIVFVACVFVIPLISVGVFLLLRGFTN